LRKQNKEVNKLNIGVMELKVVESYIKDENEILKKNMEMIVK
jgi:hypothetical protein